MTQSLLQALYGEAAAQVTEISPRLTLWANVFERWLRRPKQTRMARPAWVSLLAFTRCPPWEIDLAKIDLWMAHMARDGFTLSTLERKRRLVSSFYIFCAGQPEMVENELLFSHPKKPFNPARGSMLPRKVDYQHSYILTAEEARRLLRAVDREGSPIGKRDYAFLLALLLGGLPTGQVRCLRWGQCPENLLPAPAWEAVLRYLRSSGRLESIRPEDYLFAPQREPLVGPPTGKAQDWVSDRPISQVLANKNLKIYAAWAGLDVEKVTYASLRHTAAALQLDQGMQAEQLHSFLGRSSLKDTRHYIKCLGRMLARRGRGRLRSRRCPNFPSKGPYTRRLPGAQPGNFNGRIHGYYARLLPQDFEALDLEQAKTMGIEQEIMTLRVMLNRTFVLAKDVKNLPLLIRITNFVGLTAVRISKLLMARQEMMAGGSRTGEQPEDLLEVLKSAMDWKDGG